MESLFFLIPLAILFTVFAAKALFWAVDNHQFDDLDNAGASILFDSDSNPEAVAVSAGNRREPHD